MRAWTLITLGEDRQYGGNTGYLDDLKQTYRYDSGVANSKRLAAGDLVFLRDRKRLLGLALVSEITSAPATKTRQRCPDCDTTNIKSRRNVLPPWRCVDGHVFDQPVRRDENVVSYQASYGESFREVSENIPVSLLKKAALRPNDQLAIEEVDPSSIEKAVIALDPSLFAFFAAAMQSIRPAATEADDDQCDPDMTAGDTRTVVLRAIKARRGQKKFRDGLVRRYGRSCLVSGCQLMDIVEAAHIWPHQGEASNNLRNGLLLRSDLHTLFDLDLLGVHPQDLTIHLHPMAMQAGYSHLNGSVLKCTAKRRPSENVLQERWNSFQKWLSSTV